jgi:hypothetical protein
MAHEVHVLSYFSVPTDLSLLMHQWPEFQTGSGYSVELGSVDGTERVSVRLVEGEGRYVAITSNRDGPLFFRVLGSVIYALGGNSDNLVIDRVE